MVKQRSEKKEIEEALVLGRENARLLPKIKGWCRHLEVKMVSAGMLAQMYNLPIGLMEIVCEHASGNNIQAMQLRYVATSFILNNCKDCPFHETVDIDNLGVLVLKEAEEYAENQKGNSRDPEKERVDNLKQELVGLISGDLYQALAQSRITEQSILKLVALLDNDVHHTDAAKNLEQASKVAPELFTILAIEVICCYFPNPTIGSYCIRAIRNLITGLERVPQIITLAAEKCLTEQRNSDDICALIGDLVIRTGYIPTQEMVDRIINVQWHGHIVGVPGPSHKNYSGSNHALKEIVKRWPTIVESALKERLLKNDKTTRINSAHILVSLLDDIPAIGINLIDTLIDSLELDDDPYEESADSTACMAIAAIYVRNPSYGQRKIEEGYKRCSSEAKAILYEVYRCIAVGPQWDSVEDETYLPKYQKCIPAIIPHLLQVINGLSYSFDIKSSALDALEVVVRRQPDLLTYYLDTLLGTLANITQEEVLLAEKKTEGDMASLEKQSQQSQLRAIVRGVNKALIAVADLEPKSVFTRIKEIIPGLISSNPSHARFKAELAEIAGHLGKKHELLAEIIPILYKLLMDFDSADVRGTAVQAIGKILRDREGSIPENMMEMIIIFLNDSYIYVHKSATRVMQFAKPENFIKAKQIVERLLVLDHAYQNEPSFRREILKSVLHVTRNYPNMLENLTVPMLIEQAQFKDIHIAEDALIYFKRILPTLPKKFTGIYTKQVIDFLGRSNRDRYNYEQFTDRYRLYSSLFDLSRDAIAQALDAAKSSAQIRAKDDPWDALKLVKLLTYFEFHREAAEIADFIAKEQPKTKKYEWAIVECVIEGSLAAAEEMIIKGRPDLARVILDEGEQLEVSRDEQDNNKRFEDVIDAFTVADRVSRQLKLVQNI